ncbi:TPA: hypothetical protein ACSP0C_002100 [Aeromonas veronii]
MARLFRALMVELKLEAASLMPGSGYLLREVNRSLGGEIGFGAGFSRQPRINVDDASDGVSDWSIRKGGV